MAGAWMENSGDRPTRGVEAQAFTRVLCHYWAYRYAPVDGGLAGGLPTFNFLIILFRVPCLPRRPKGDRLAALLAPTNLSGLPSLYHPPVLSIAGTAPIASGRSDCRDGHTGKRRLNTAHAKTCRSIDNLNRRRQPISHPLYHSATQ
jgi:hypothetical protein